MKYQIIKGDVNQIELDELCHAMLTDPPYHLESIVKRFGKEGSKPAQFGRDGAFGRVGKGFMQKLWDGGDVAFRADTWHHLLAQLYPGGFGAAFSSAKLFHRMMVAIEDGGAIMHPMVGWVYASGFPKATRIDTQVDKMAGAEREVIGYESERRNRKNLESGYRPNEYSSGDFDKFPVTVPTTPLTQQWQGHRYGQQALAPALEPLAMFQRPYDGKPVLNMIQTGAGALWIDGTRIGGSDDDDPRLGGNGTWDTSKAAQNVYSGGYAGERIQSSALGRWPKNLLLQHLPSCTCLGETEETYTINAFDDDMHPFGDAIGEEYSSSSQTVKALIWQCEEGCPVRQFAEINGVKKSGLMTSSHHVTHAWGYHGGKRAKPTLTPTYADEGTVDRFFYQTHWAYDIFERMNDVFPALYFAKASKSEKNAGLDTFIPQTVSDGREKAIDNPFQRGKTPRKNVHPSVKPLELTRYLASLLLPPAHYSPRRLFVPFSGSGSELIGGLLAGFEEVIGVELDMDDEYIPIATARLDFWAWAKQHYGDLSPKEILKLVNKDAKKKDKAIGHLQEVLF